MRRGPAAVPPATFFQAFGLKILTGFGVTTVSGPGNDTPIRDVKRNPSGLRLNVGWSGRRWYADHDNTTDHGQLTTEH